MSDFRAASQDSKRFKEHKAKWAKGARPSPGVFLSPTNTFLCGSDSQRQKARPAKKDISIPVDYPTHNLVKQRNARCSPIPQSHSRARYAAMAELSDPNNASSSLRELLPSPSSPMPDDRAFAADQVLYSFDSTDSPGRPLSLDAFFKASPKETERFVEREYEILDANGDALKGRKARRNLRQRSPRPNPGAVHHAARDDVLEVDGFEII